MSTFVVGSKQNECVNAPEGKGISVTHEGPQRVGKEKLRNLDGKAHQRR
jgi:hypothetical protein